MGQYNYCLERGSCEMVLVYINRNQSNGSVELHWSNSKMTTKLLQERPDCFQVPALHWNNVLQMRRGHLQITFASTFRRCAARTSSNTPYSSLSSEAREVFYAVAQLSLKRWDQAHAFLLSIAIVLGPLQLTKSLSTSGFATRSTVSDPHQLCMSWYEEREARCPHPCWTYVSMSVLEERVNEEGIPSGHDKWTQI